MHGSSGIIKNFGTNRVIGLLILPLVCTGSHREFPSHGRFFTDGRFPSCMFCQTRVILFMGNVHDLTHSVFYVVHDCGCIPYPSRGRKPWLSWSWLESRRCIPYPSRGRKQPNPHGRTTGRQRCIPYPSRGRKQLIPALEEQLNGCIPYPSRGRKRDVSYVLSPADTDASPTPHGDGNFARS